MATISNTVSSPDLAGRPTWKSWALFSPVLGWLLVFVITPTLILFVYAFFSLDEHSRITPDFTLDNFRLVFTSVYIGFFAKSALYAGATTILCIAIGYPVAYYIGRSPVDRRNRLLLAVMIPFLTSFLIRTFAWMRILDQAGVLNMILRAVHLIPWPLGENFEVLRTPAAVMIALVYTYLPFMILPIYGSVEKLDESLIEASYDLGASPMRAFWRVILPLTMPGISAGTLMVFVPAVAMFAITQFMSGGKIRLIGDVIEEQFVAAQNIPFGSALGMVLLIAFMATSIFSHAGPTARFSDDDTEEMSDDWCVKRGAADVFVTHQSSLISSSSPRSPCVVNRVVLYNDSLLRKVTLMDKMVELKNVSKRFGDFVAVAGVDLDIRAGEFLTLLGPSGCGKTTLLRMISGFETPSDGRVLLAGQDVTDLPPYRRDVNQVFQSYALFPHLSVWKNVAFGLQMKKVARAELRQRVDRAIDMVSLAGFEHRKPAQLSGGQRQRVALARALVCEPKVLLLDEPLAALDAKLRRSMQIELKRLQSRLGITFLFVTHDQEEALVMSDRIAVVNKGLIEQIGGVSEIYHRPATPFVANFIGQANVLEATVVKRQADRVTLKCGDAVQLNIAQNTVNSSDKVLISIRPEKIRLSRNARDGLDNFQATVIEEIFRGATAQLLLQTSCGLQLTAVVANQSTADEAFHRGDAIFCQVHEDDVVVLNSASGSLSPVRGGEG